MGLASVLGITAILRTSATAFNVLKVVGAIYLFWMGGRFVLTSFKKKAEAVEVV